MGDGRTYDHGIMHDGKGDIVDEPFGYILLAMVNHSTPEDVNES